MKKAILIYLPVCMSLSACNLIKPHDSTPRIYTKLSCRDSFLKINLKRDMSEITFDYPQPLPLYSASGTKWIYTNNPDEFDAKVVTVTFYQSDNSFMINSQSRSRASAMCFIDDKNDIPKPLTKDYKSPVAIKHEEDAVKQKEHQRKEIEKNRPLMEMAQRKADNQCRIYLKDLASRTNLSRPRLIHAHAMNVQRKMFYCTILAHDAAWGAPIVIKIMGRGNNYQYSY